MDISKLAKTPKLERLEINGEDIIAEYGEPITFYMVDHLDINTYFNFYKLQQNEDGELLNSLLRKLIRKEDGSPALGDGEVFPTNLTLAILVRINEFLGKSNAKASSTSKTGKSQK
jgi:hypothetical protein